MKLLNFFVAVSKQLFLIFCLKTDVISIKYKTNYKSMKLYSPRSRLCKKIGKTRKLLYFYSRKSVPAECSTLNSQHIQCDTLLKRPLRVNVCFLTEKNRFEVANT